MPTDTAIVQYKLLEIPTILRLEQDMQGRAEPVDPFPGLNKGPPQTCTNWGVAGKNMHSQLRVKMLKLDDKLRREGVGGEGRKEGRERAV